MSGHAILVLGMHRSGTSALTRVLALCGAGLPATLFPSVAGDNDAGYWESAPLIEFHQRLLWHLGTGMLDPALPPEDWPATDFGRAALAEAEGIALAEWGAHPCWVVKEPRMCRLVPFWLEVLRRVRRTPVAVHCLREPTDVAASLARRGGMPRDRAELLWLQHVAAAERATRGLPRVFLRYDELLCDWRSLVDRVASILPTGILDAASASEEVSRFIDPALRRQRHASNEPLAGATRRVRDALFDAARTGTDPSATTVDAAWAAASPQFSVATPR